MIAGGFGKLEGAAVVAKRPLEAAHRVVAGAQVAECGGLARQVADGSVLAQAPLPGPDRGFGALAVEGFGASPPEAVCFQLRCSLGGGPAPELLDPGNEEGVGPAPLVEPRELLGLQDSLDPFLGARRLSAELEKVREGLPHFIGSLPDHVQELRLLAGFEECDDLWCSAGPLERKCAQRCQRETMGESYGHRSVLRALRL